MTYPIVVLISGNGSNLQAIIDAIDQGQINAKIRAVISNKADAYGLKRAEKAGIPTHVVAHETFDDREEFDMALRKVIDQYQPKLIVLAGFMRRLGSNFVARYLGHMINIHPSLLPKYPGLNTHQRVLQAGDQYHGVSIHFVTDDLDRGPVICQSSFEVHPTDSLDSLQRRVHSIEHRLYPEVIDWFSEDRIKLEGDQVEFDGKLLSPTGILINTDF